MAIVKDRALLNEDGSISSELLNLCIKEHESMIDRYRKLDNYYDGKQSILNRTFSNPELPNNRLVANHAQYISDMATGYVFGIPILYAGEGSEEINNIFTEIDEDSHNNELALDISILGVGYELVYMNDNEVPTPELAVLSPFNTFLVVDSTVKHRAMFAVMYIEKKDINGTKLGYDVTVYTDKKEIQYFVTDLNSTSPEIKGIKEHYFNEIPIIEYKNNKKLKGDFEGVISLIDAYNLLQSDRVNDKEQLVDAILAVKGISFGDDEEEMTETSKLLKEMKILELPKDGDAEWLVKNLNETEVEVLKKSLKDDIHEFSKVPCLTDENFVGNASGIAMKYKLLGFEQLGKTKERYFKKGLRQRLKLMSKIENLREKDIDLSKIDIIMKRSLPVDEELLARISQETSDLLSWETRVQRFDSEIDVEEERKKLDEDKKKSIEENQKAFGSYGFKHDIDDKEDDNDEYSSVDSSNNG
ncbi:phage portal protein [Clostridium perfringens]|uniref:phage portal protein n=1 Tax=Clostridium perfringens TaxID=1502 RepID=UPI002247CB2E|nr:phage portal protein [Clostridium perfringens]MCX0353267.1 phage portal protein [Clostridium perfringens]